MYQGQQKELLPQLYFLILAAKYNKKGQRNNNSFTLDKILSLLCKPGNDLHPSEYQW